MQRDQNQRRAKRMLLAGASTASFACGLVLAAAAAAHAETAMDDKASGSGSQVDEVVVTGSRIKRTTFDTPQPITVLGKDTIERSGKTEISDVINELPQLSAGLNGANTSFSFGNAGLNQVDLRNLGTYRTLTIVDGRRRVGTPNDANFLAFDLSNLPIALVDHVEVITGGTSAVYGSDAVAGVVNVILKKDFEGLQFDSLIGSTTSGDWNTYNYGVTAGINYDRGNAVLSVSHSQSSRLLKRDRGLDTEWTFLTNPANTSNSDGIPDFIPYKNVKFFTFGIPTLSGWVPDGPTGSPWREAIWDSAANDFRPFDAGPRGVVDGFASLGPDGGRGRFYDTLFVPLNKTNVYAKVRHDITDDIKLNLEAIYSRTSSGDVIGPVFDVSSSFVSTDNAFMPNALRQRLIANGADGFWISREHDEFGPRTSEITRQYYTVSAGLEGKIKQFDWYVTYEHGATDVSLTNFNDRYDAHWFQALDSIIDPATGQAECRDPAARAAGCVPVNVFGVGTISPQALNYVRINQHTTTDTVGEDLAQAYFTGNLVDLWAGPLGIAAGVEYRRDTIDFRPSYVWEQALGFFASQFEPIDKSTSVSEYFAEATLPILRDKPFVKDLTIDGAYRISDYQLAGRTNSWKVGAEWSPVDDIRFRFTRAQAVRAPGPSELFDPGSRGAQGITDPCDPLQLDSGTANRRANCAALGLDPVNFDPVTRRVTTLVLTNGNEDLNVETAKTTTIGVVVRPRFLPGFRVAVDWYDINLGNAINRIGAQASADNCVDLPTLDNQFCQFVERGSDGNIKQIRDTYVNVGGFHVEGVDFQASYGFELSSLASRFGHGESDLGRLNFDLIGSYLQDSALIDVNLATGATTVFDDAGLWYLPTWRGLLNATWSKGPVSVNWQIRYASPTVISNRVADLEEVYGSYGHVPASWIHDFSVTWNSPWNARFVVGVDDVFDNGVRQHPYTVSGTSNIDNIRGRFAFVGVTLKLGQ